MHAYTMRCTPYEVHAHEVYLIEMHARKMHAREVHAREMHAREIHACETPAHQMHARGMHACEVQINHKRPHSICRDLSLQNTSFCAKRQKVPIRRRTYASIGPNRIPAGSPPSTDPRRVNG